MTAPSREQMTQWALDCGLIDQRDVDNGIVDALFDDFQRFGVIDLRRFAELAYAAGQTAEREACAKVCEDFADGTSAYEVHHRFAAYKCADLIRKRGGDENIS
jgi:hypothetical protein